MRIALVLFIVTGACLSCVKRPFVPVNTGREHGNPTTPWMVSHLPEKNQWALARSGHHNVFQKILCFSYPCRKMIGRHKALMAISFEDYQKRIKKNAKKGLYKKPLPAPKPAKQDTVRIAPPVQKVAAEESTALKAAPEPAALKGDSLVILKEILFETNSHNLKAEQYEVLDEISRFLMAHPNLEAKVLGHTDKTGNERHNVQLSARRAEAVAEYLIDHGASFDQVYFEGFGSSQPIASNDSEEGRRKNRRVEILFRNPER